MAEWHNPSVNNFGMGFMVVVLVVALFTGGANRPNILSKRSN